MIADDWYRLPACENHPQTLWVRIKDRKIIAAIVHGGKEQTGEEFRKTFAWADTYKGFANDPLVYERAAGKKILDILDPPKPLGLAPVAMGALAIAVVSGLAKRRVKQKTKKIEQVKA